MCSSTPLVLMFSVVRVFSPTVRSGLAGLVFVASALLWGVLVAIKNVFCFCPRLFMFLLRYVTDALRRTQHAVACAIMDFDIFLYNFVRTWGLLGGANVVVVSCWWGFFAHEYPSLAKVTTLLPPTVLHATTPPWSVSEISTAKIF